LGRNLSPLDPFGISLRTIPQTALHHYGNSAPNALFYFRRGKELPSSQSLSE
jgi:hypothetical protein